MKKVISYLLYIGVGCLLHIAFIGPVFDWSSAWTWAFLLAWPVAVIVVWWSAIMTFGLIILLVIACYALWDSYVEGWR